MSKVAARIRRVKYGQGLAANLTQRAAALAAGYRECPSLDALASKLAKHPEVQAEIARCQAASRAKAVAKRRRALEILTQQLEFDLGPYIEEYEAPVLTLTGQALGADGKPMMQKKLRIDVKKIKEDKKAHLLAGLEIRKDGSIKFNLHDKQGAIDRLAKLRGWNKPEKVQHSGSVGLGRDPAQMTQAEIDAELAALERARAPQRRHEDTKK
jgi:phage terminase small subunit